MTENFLRCIIYILKGRVLRKFAHITGKMDIKNVKGIGEVREKQYKKLGITTAEELCAYVPIKYENRGLITPLIHAIGGEKKSCVLTVSSPPRAAKLKGGKNIVRFTAYDESAKCEIAYFCRSANAIPRYEVGENLRVFGRFYKNNSTIVTYNPICERITQSSPLPTLYPVYKTTQGLSSKIIQKNCLTAASSLENNCSLFEEYIPSELLVENSLSTLKETYTALHSSESEENIAKARHDICYREFFSFFSMIIVQKNEKLERKPEKMSVIIPETEISELPYPLTNAQTRVINEIISDLASDYVMRRIVVGDVGCGKTVIAQMAALAVINAGYTVALMAPTEILATQHYEGLAPYFESKGFECALLLGSTTAKEKKEIRKRLVSDTDNAKKIDLIIGTHALLTESVEIDKLGLAIIDEQHRFGVIQRQKLINKGRSVNSLSLSATPIPRSYAKMLYGDTDSSIVDELPPGRKPPKTFVVNEGYRQRLYSFIEKKVSEGRQVYVVCPMIEPTEYDDEADTQKIRDLSAETHLERLKERFPSLRIDILHGKMRPNSKNDVMERFYRHEIDVLVSTTVIEVGVNVPNATLMIIEGADRFGLSQLHQLRGRVARGSHECFCVLVSDSTSDESINRLQTLAKHSSGFDVAEEDFKQRGPGDLFSMQKSGNIRQSGEFSFKYGEFCDNEYILQKAYSDASAALSRPDSEGTKRLLAYLERYSQGALTE